MAISLKTQQSLGQFPRFQAFCSFVSDDDVNRAQIFVALALLLLAFDSPLVVDGVWYRNAAEDRQV
jgi:hypothetical protein